MTAALTWFRVWFFANLLSACFLVAGGYVSDRPLSILLLSVVGAELVVVSVMLVAAVRTWQITRYMCTTVAIVTYLTTTELMLLWYAAPVLTLVALALTFWVLVTDQDIRRHPYKGDRFA